MGMTILLTLFLYYCCNIRIGHLLSCLPIYTTLFFVPVRLYCLVITSDMTLHPFKQKTKDFNHFLKQPRDVHLVSYGFQDFALVKGVVS